MMTKLLRLRRTASTVLAASLATVALTAGGAEAATAPSGYDPVAATGSLSHIKFAINARTWG